MRTTLLFLLLSSVTYGQQLSYGVLGGGSVTDSFQTRDVPTGSAQLPYQRFYTSSKDWIAGASVELHLLSNFSVEVDGLYRKLHFESAGVTPGGSLSGVSPSPVVTWEFPVLAKYRFARRGVRPVVEVGPSFRTTGNLNGTTPSHAGFTAGFGAEVPWKRFAITPVVRYTRWAADDATALRPATNPDQVDLLVGFSRSSEVHSRPFGRRFALGAVVGSTLKRDLPDSSFSHLTLVTLPDGSTALRSVVTTYKGQPTFIAGPALEVELCKRLYLEVDAIYHPLRYKSTVTLEGTVLRTDHFSEAITWELPVLAKYKFGTRAVRPLLELGPSFRLPQQVNFDLATTGVTAGAGIEWRLGAITIAPVARFTHWSSDRTGVTQNPLTLLVGIEF